MTYRESQDGHLKTEKVVRISLYKAIAIVITAILSSAGVSIWGTLRVANTIPFRVDAIEKVVDDLPTKYMPLDLSLEKWKNNDEYHKIVIQKLDSLDTKIDSIRNLIK